MKVYLAGRFGDRETLRELRGVLTRAGVMVTSRWLNSHHQAEDPTDEELGQYAYEDLRDIDDADVLVLWNPLHHHRSGRGGRHVELGYALAKGKRVILIGQRENVFHHLPCVEVLKDPYSLVDHLVP